MQALPKKTHRERNVPVQQILYEMLEVARLNEKGGYGNPETHHLHHHPAWTRRCHNVGLRRME
jgi:hypothetical protein